MKKKLRVGLLLDGDQIPAWAYAMVQEIQESHFAEVVVTIKDVPPEPAPRKGFFGRLWDNRNLILFILYQRLEARKYKCNPDAFEMKDIRGILSVPEIKVTPTRTRFSDSFPETALEEIRNYQPDVLIRLGFRILRGEILKLPRYGIWSFHHGDNTVNRGGPAGFWEVIEGWDETGVILQILTEDLDNGKILFRSTSQTNKLSVAYNRNGYYWKALSFIPQKLNELYEHGEEAFLKRIEELNQHPQFYARPLYQDPGNWPMFKGLLRFLADKLALKWHHLLYQEQWILLFQLNKNRQPATSFHRFRKIVPPKDRFWADPHVVYRNGKYYIFIEELVYAENKGHISVIEMTEEGNYSAPVKVLERDYHLSYPFLLEENGELYMIPETRENKTIEVYRCVEFPGKWELEKVLMKNLRALDTTVLKKDGYYWLFTNIQRNDGAPVNDELFVFRSDRLLSDNWEPHRLNPVISAVKTSRPAGGFLFYNNNIYRPSQYCARRYGYGLNINVITELSINRYAETTTSTLFPEWDKSLLATHSLAYAEKLTVIDALSKRSKWL